LTLLEQFVISFSVQVHLVLNQRLLQQTSAL